MKYYLILHLVLIISILSSCESKSSRKNSRKRIILNEFLLVTKVVDGDTFWADDGSKKGIKVRFIGIDAPESRNMFKIKKEYFGEEAKEYLVELIAGKSVKLVSDIDSLDRYGRTLSYVYLKDGTFVNAEIIRNGYAVIMTIPPNVRYADKFLELQQEARKNNKGLWKRD